MKMMTTRVGAVLTTAALSVGLHAGDLDDDLAAALDAARPEEGVSALLYLLDQADLPALTAELRARRAPAPERHEIIVRQLQATAERSQKGLVAHLEALQGAGRIESFEAFWISSIVRVDGTAAEIRALAERLDIDRAFLNYPIETVAPTFEGPADEPMIDGLVEPGVEAVRAPEVWALGIDGSGVLVANIDTGVDGSHSALASRWRGAADPRYAGHPEWAWLDPYAGQNDFPYDLNSHGTHTLGTVCGGAPGDQIGVAPGAQWIAAGAIDRGGGIETTVVDAIESMQWMIDPDGNPSTSWDVPAVVSNSWGLVTSHGYAPCDETFWTPIDAMEAVGTVVVFSAGNEGTSGLRRPADRATDEYSTYAVAAIDPASPTWEAAGFSSRGPTFCTPDGTAAVKPDIAAPGVNTRSALPGGGYGLKSGTSMASPHINGVIALMLQANPELTVEQVKQIIFDTAVDLGATGEDNTYGYGMVDAYEAVQIALSLTPATIILPEGLPEFVHPAGGTTLVVRIEGQQGTPDPSTARLLYSTGGAFESLPMAHLGGTDYVAEFAAVPCGADVEYFLAVDTVEGDVVVSPAGAPDISTYHALAYAGVVVAYEEDFESGTGWTVASVDLTDGAWDRGIPAGGDFAPGDRGDPPADADGSGQCFLTDNAPGNSDVDGGPTTLTSPTLDATGLADARIEYRRWFTNDDQDIDRMVVELSNDDGATWTELESVPGAGGWKRVSWRIADVMPPTSQMRIRFSATDNPNDSVTEGGVDGVRIFSYSCGSTPGDATGDGVVDIQDLLAVLAAWGPCVECPEDLDGDGTVGVTDLLEVLGNWS